MSKKKFTPWFVNGETPARPGVYNVSCQREEQSGNWWRMFDGSRWAYYWRRTPDTAASDPGTFRHTSPPASWRGLAEKPA